MIYSKDHIPDEIEIRQTKDFAFTDCNVICDFGILVHSKGRTYHYPSFVTEGCNTFFVFKGKKRFTHEIEKVERVSTPEWVRKWVEKNDYSITY